MVTTIALPKLDGLQPTPHSTLLKLVEEAGELSRAILQLGQKPDDPTLLAEVVGELLDVAQTCVTMIFVMEEMQGVYIDPLIDAHLEKLDAKGYAFDHALSYAIFTKGRFKYMALPQLELPEVDLLRTVCKIQEELGELTQFLGKRQGASGETADLSDLEAAHGCALELLDVAQCCFTMMYILAARYQVDLKKAVDRHVRKLCRKGYCRL